MKKYELREELGKRAYIGLEELKKDELEANANKIKSKKVRYKIIDTGTNIVKSINISGCNSQSIVKIYIHNDNCNNINVKIVNNNIVCYNDAASKVITLESVLVDSNNLSFEFVSSSSFTLDADVVISGINTSIVECPRILKMGDYYYKIERGFGETILTKYSSLNNLIAGSYDGSAKYQLTMYDASKLLNTDISVGNEIYILGVDSNSKLVLQKVIADEVITIKDLAPQASCLTPLTSSSMAVIYSVGGLLYKTIIDNDVVGSSIEITNKMIKRIIGLRSIKSLCGEYLVLGVMDDGGCVYIASYLGSNNTFNKIIKLGKADDISIDYNGTDMIVYTSLDNVVTSIKVDLTASNWYVANSKAVIKPCDWVVRLDTDQLALLNRCITKL